jgi:hypothetical protein
MVICDFEDVSVQKHPHGKVELVRWLRTKGEFLRLGWSRYFNRADTDHSLLVCAASPSFAKCSFCATAPNRGPKHKRSDTADSALVTPAASKSFVR